MEKQFWLERWELGQTGFHQSEINPCLREYWHELHCKGDVFVPLCGKSLDMLWLREQGIPVLGVELSQLAVRAFFGENELNIPLEFSSVFFVFFAHFVFSPLFYH